MNNKYGLGSIEVAGLSLGFKLVKDIQFCCEDMNHPNLWGRVLFIGSNV